MINSRQFRQQRLFQPVGMRKQPHQMGFEEFAASPGTMFHGGDTPKLGTGYRKGGFHVGTRKAAEERLQMKRKGDWTVHDDDLHVHPVRLAVPMRNTPRNRIRDVHQDVGGGEGKWATKHRMYYKNVFEDPGSTSAVLKSTRDVRTFTQLADEASRRGGIPSGEAQYYLERRQRTGEEPTLRPEWAQPWSRLNSHQFGQQGTMLHGGNPGGMWPLHPNPDAVAPEHFAAADRFKGDYAQRQLDAGRKSWDQKR